MTVHTLSVAKRLGIITATGILASGLLGALALTQMYRINNSETFLAEDAVPSLVIINEINDDANNLRLNELSYVNADGAQQIAADAAVGAKLRGDVSDGIAAYEKLVDNDMERRGVEQLKQQWAAYLAEHDKTLAVAKDVTGEFTAEERTQVRDVSGKVFTALGDAIDVLISMNATAVADSHAQSQSVFRNSLVLMIGMLIMSILLSVALAAWIARGLLRQLGGEPAYAAEIAGRIAEGDLTMTVETKDNDTSSLLYATRSMRDNLVRIVSEVRSGTDSVATASQEIAAGNRDLSSRTEEQASSLEQTAASMEEITSTVKQNADNARQGNQMATTASSIAARGGKVVSQVVETMDEINASSKQIADIITVIDAIAFQTNILALNAAVEAARAGEQGRGFAVVASEVRSLAHRSASAAKEIKELITASVEKVNIGTVLVGQAGATMQEVVDSVKSVNELMSEISVASDEQRRGIEQVNAAITQMDQVTQQNAALVEEATAAADTMHEQADRLMRVVGVFKLEGQAMKAPAVKGQAAGTRPGADRKDALALRRKVAQVTEHQEWEAF